MSPAEQHAEELQARYLAELRRRIEWQAAAAYGAPAAEPVVAPPAPPEPVAIAADSPAPRTPRAPTLWQLESLVAARSERFPERAAEWDAYLFHLRQHADTDGRLPAELSALVQTAFADVFAA